MAKQYVQHISGQGEKWEVRAEYLGHSDWRVVAHGPTAFHYLPKSAYVLCEPPVVWRDVTAECDVTERGWVMHKDRSATEDNGYRRRKVRASVERADAQWSTGWAIIIEQKVE